jgi:hypothetical protein
VQSEEGSGSAFSMALPAAEHRPTPAPVGDAA